jgi:AcrR family transcriptional regulator
MSSRKKRAYRQRVRAEGAAETRRRIIDVTRELLTRSSLQSVGLPEIAAAAEVARSTIYAAFGSREGLFVAVAEDLLERGGFARIGIALRNPDVRAALENSLREGARLYAAEHPVARAMFFLAAIDPDAASGVARANLGRREGMARMAQRLAEAGLLREGVSEADAADVLWVLTSFETFDQLYLGRKLTADQVADRLVIMGRTLFRDGAPRRPA